MDIIIALLLLGVIIFIHELGHFLAARFFRMPVSEFSIGMGPELY
ncbi:MAG: site-2 protease family protein, partial [Cetobacterium sp.]